VIFSHGINDHTTATTDAPPTASIRRHEGAVLDVALRTCASRRVTVAGDGLTTGLFGGVKMVTGSGVMISDVQEIIQVIESRRKAPEAPEAPAGHRRRKLV
jgi:hypothetical protein